LSEDDTPVRSRKQLNSSGFNDFCIKDIRLKEFGRREIDFAEQGNMLQVLKYIIYIVIIYIVKIKNILGCYLVKYTDK